MSSNLVQEKEALSEFEISNLPPDYKSYYLAKRLNFCNTIRFFPELWELYLQLDQIILREADDLKVTIDTGRAFPMLLYFNAHAKMRVSMELAMSGCLTEARSILRDAIESAAHGHHMLKDTEHQKTWLNKEMDLKAFKQEFEHNKGTKLFDGLPELHKMWGDLSESGSHSNVTAMCDRFVQVDNGKTFEWRLNYCGVEVRLWQMQLFQMMLTLFDIEQMFFLDYKTRLGLDPTLVKMRTDFALAKEKLRKIIIVRFNISPPPTPSISTP